MPKYQVIVGNIRTVCTTLNEKEAKDTFHEYKMASKSGKGRAGGEDVTLTKDGEPIKEYKTTNLE